MSHPVLVIVNELLAPHRLTYIQEIVVLRSWEGKRYREIATEAGYDYDYVKEVGFQLWQNLSQVLGRKVTKKNVRMLLTELEASNHAASIVPVSSPPLSNLETVDFPSSPLSPNSRLYVERSGIESMAYREVLKPGGLVRIKAPQQMGKTSLVLRIVAHAQANNLLPVVLDLHSADQRLFGNLNDFLRWLCIHVSRQVNLEPQLNDYWDEESGSKLSCNAYFQMFLLEQIDQPIVLVFDEVTPLFEYPELARDVLPLFRIWHELAAQQKIWQNLRLVVVHNTEMYVSLQMNQSPFNVGLPIELSEFNLNQVCELAQRHQLNQPEASSLDALNTLVGGHPYLLQLAFYWLQQDLSMTKLIEEAATEAGIYRQYLQRLWNRLYRTPSLLDAFRQVVLSHEPIALGTITAYQLESLGLVKRTGNQVVVRCQLYRDYFKAQCV